MNKIKLLDVTLRDGGHRINFSFSLKQLIYILHRLDKAGLDYIEIGYRNGFLNANKNLGWAGLCRKEYLLVCQSYIHQAKIAVMVHPSHVNEHDLVELKEHGVSLLRVCIVKGKFDEAHEVIRMAQRLGFEISINFTHISQYSQEELKTVIAKVNHYEPTMIYFADSNGSLLPQAIEKIYKVLLNNSLYAFGFHPHDNLGLAQANTLTAIDNGVTFIDSSLAGIGKGIGNLKTEFFTAYLKANDCQKYNLEKLLDAANYIRSEFNESFKIIEAGEFIRGISDLSTAQMKALMVENA